MDQTRRYMNTEEIDTEMQNILPRKFWRAIRILLGHAYKAGYAQRKKEDIGKVRLFHEKK